MVTVTGVRAEPLHDIIHFKHRALQVVDLIV